MDEKKETRNNKNTFLLVGLGLLFAGGIAFGVFLPKLSSKKENALIKLQENTKTEEENTIEKIDNKEEVKGAEKSLFSRTVDYSSIPKPDTVAKKKLPFSYKRIESFKINYYDISSDLLIKENSFNVQLNNKQHTITVGYANDVYGDSNTIRYEIFFDNVYLLSSSFHINSLGKESSIEENFNFIKNSVHILKDISTNTQYLVIQYNSINDGLSYINATIVNDYGERMYNLKVSDPTYQVRVFAWYDKDILNHSYYMEEKPEAGYEPDEEHNGAQEKVFYSKKDGDNISYYFVEFVDDYFYALISRYDGNNILDIYDYKVYFENGVLKKEVIGEYPLTQDYPIETKTGHKYIEIISGAYDNHE